MLADTARMLRPNAETVVELARTTGALDLVEQGRTRALEYDETWGRTAAPAIERLLALPDPDRPRRRQRSQPVIVFTRR